MQDKLGRTVTIDMQLALRLFDLVCACINSDLRNEHEIEALQLELMLKLPRSEWPSRFRFKDEQEDA